MINLESADRTRIIIYYLDSRFFHRRKFKGVISVGGCLDNHQRCCYFASDVAATHITTPNAILLTKSARLYMMLSASALPAPA